eukprot:5673270-Amphidinium_carterae.2
MSSRCHIGSRFSIHLTFAFIDMPLSCGMFSGSMTLCGGGARAGLSFGPPGGGFFGGFVGFVFGGGPVPGGAVSLLPG